LDPNMVAAHLQLANSYMLNTPRDLDQAEEHAQRAIALMPEEATPHDVLGDVYRQQGRLEEARDAYTEAANYAGDDGLPYQQRGHVNSFLGDYEAARSDYDRAIAMARGNQGPSFGVFRSFVNVHADDPEAAVEELTTLADEIDGMDIPEPTGLKIFALGSAVQIALHHGMADEAEALIADWSALMREQAAATDSEAFERGQEAAIAYNEARLAAKRGDYAAAEAKADEIAQLVEPDANPRKMEPVHEIRGIVALEQGDYNAAVEHLRQGNVENDIYIRYHLAQALEGAGETDEAMELYNDVATWNFNGVGAALTRRDAMAKLDARS
ncbi:MAG: tetratricopeptide repeat protein, partial [Rhodothermales bacterium]|nr:tetratricopeptide repeat protein [Rhodothermales bacterium]